MTPPVVILCGGRGTRLQADVPGLPKPLVEIGDHPILWHVIQIYASQGLRRFVLCTGYKGELIERFAAQTAWPDGVTVECVDTGLDTPTGGRIHRVADRVSDGTFLATYADGVADIDLRRLQAFHADHGRLATVTVVRPLLQFGIAKLSGDDDVVGFEEKPRSEHWINGGFFAFEPGALRYLTGSSVLEREPLEGLAEDRQLRAHRHTGFWDCMDTYKDAVLLNDLWEKGGGPLEAQAARQLIARNPRWYHTIEVAPGVATPGLVDLRPIAPRVLPPRLDGRRALDLGTYDGFWAFELERRGAETVAIDVGAAEEAEWPPLTRVRLRAEAEAMGVELGLGFDLAAEALGSAARRVTCDVYDLEPDAVGGEVDVVFCGALLLHLRDPIRALERVHATLAPGGVLILLEPFAVRQTLLSPTAPVARFEAHLTAFNWWVANIAALRAWIRAAGFRSTQVRGVFRPEAREGLGVRHVAIRAPR